MLVRRRQPSGVDDDGPPDLVTKLERGEVAPQSHRASAGRNREQRVAERLRCIDGELARKIVDREDHGPASGDAVTAWPERTS
jgi:hypothetical protein